MWTVGSRWPSIVLFPTVAGIYGMSDVYERIVPIMADVLAIDLTKGTAEKYKKDIDEVADPERYFFRGPVSWTIRTYSKFMHLPATYSSRGSHFTREGGSMSDGTVV